MQASWIHEGGKLLETEVLVLPMWEGEKKSSWFDDPHVQFALKSGDFSGKRNQVLLVYPTEKGQGFCKRVLLLGLGPKENISLF